MTPEQYAAAATITAALLASVIAFVGTVLGKDQKTSEFRQAWIDALREDLASYVAIIDVLADITLHKIREEGREAAVSHAISNADELVRLHATQHRIMMRLNPEEHTNLIAAINALSELVGSDRFGDKPHQHSLVNTVIAESQAVLKAEWKRVKRGEPVFRITKYSALVLLAVSVLLVGIWLSRHIV